MSDADAAAPPLLQIDGLTVSFAQERQGSDAAVPVVEDLALTLSAGRSLGLVGESGCGKSVTAMAVMGLLPSPPARVERGRIAFAGEDLLRLSRRRLRALCGDRIGMIFQEPMTSLNPVYSIGFQLTEVLRIHRGLRGARARDAAAQALAQVGIGAARARLAQYPHELSGGLRQRVMIAMSLLCRPQLLIADEPTTALDVTIQAQILALLKTLRQEHNLALLMITHDLGVVAELCERVAVMYAGRIVEQAATATLFANPAHPYSRGLLDAMPRLGQKRRRLNTIEGRVPDPERRRALRGCYFAERCPRALERCGAEPPPLRALGGRRSAACWNPL